MHRPALRAAENRRLHILPGGCPAVGPPSPAAEPRPLALSPRRLAAAVLAILSSLMLLIACGTGSGADPDAPGADRDQVELTVFAAASLRIVFDQVGEEFEAATPGVSVRFSYGGSSDLVAQLDAGAPADVLVTANTATMDSAVDASTVTAEPALIAANTLVLVTPADNPAGITDLADAARPDADLVVCAPQVPCGTATRTVADSAGVELAPVSEESSVTDVLGKVTSGQADAGIVYATDAADAGEAVQTIDLPGAEDARTEYPAAVTADSSHPQQAQEFVDFLQESTAQDLLAEAGFQAP